jgi:GDP-mannose 4,6 dehydratase
VCTGISRTVRELARTAFDVVGLDWEQYVVVDPAFVRPPDPVALIGDPSKARAQLGWEPRTSFEDMIAEMVEADLRALQAEAAGAPAAQPSSFSASRARSVARPPAPGTGRRPRRAARPTGDGDGGGSAARSAPARRSGRRSRSAGRAWRSAGRGGRGG